MQGPAVTRSAHVDTFTRDNLPAADQWPEFRFDLPRLRYPASLNCVEPLLDLAAEQCPERRCLVTDECTWTYLELFERANQVAHVLVEDLGLVPGNRVLLRGPNTPWLVVCWLAVVKAGGVVVTTMHLLRARELKSIMDVSECRLCLCDQRYRDELDAAGVAGMTCLGYGGEGGCGTEGGYGAFGTFGADGTDSLAALAAGKPRRFDTVRTAVDDVCLLAFTSGTTGAPKATMHMHRDLLAIADTYSREVLRPTKDDLFTGSPSLGFTFGLGGLLVFPLRARAAALLLERARPEQLLDAVGRHRASIVFTSPTAYRGMLAHVGDADLGALRACVSAGEHLDAPTAERFLAATGLRVMDGIGSTEMLHIFIAAPVERIRLGATGVPVPGYVAQVQDGSGAPVDDGEAGLLAVKGPTGCRYLRGDRQKTYVRNGWNMTGDVYVRDRDGYFWYQSRVDDMIVSAGYNIAGQEVEEALLRHSAVAEVAVVGIPDVARGSVVKAFVVVRPGVPATQETASALREFVKSEIAPYKYPRLVEFVEALPRTSTGKVQRFTLRERPIRSDTGVAR